MRRRGWAVASGRTWCPRRVATLALAVAAGAAHAQAPRHLTVGVFLSHYPGESDLWSGLRDSFQQAVPGVQVGLTLFEWADAEAKVSSWAGTGYWEAPDLAIIQDIDLPRLAHRVLPLETLLDRDFQNQLIPAMLDRGRLSGVLHGLPWLATSEVLYYQADLFAARGLQPPTTWEELAEAATALSTPPEVYGFGVPARPGGDAGGFFLSMLWSCGGDVFDAQGSLRLRDEQALQATTALANLRNRRATQPETITYSYAELESLFAGGRLAMMIGSSAFAQQLVAAPQPVEFGVAPLPGLGRQLTQVRCQHLVIFDHTPHPEDCLAFLRHAFRRETAEALVARAGVPVRRDLQRELVKREPIRPFVEALEGARGRPLQYWDLLCPRLEQTVCVLMRGALEPQEALQACLSFELAGEPAPAPPER